MAKKVFFAVWIVFFMTAAQAHACDSGSCSLSRSSVVTGESSKKLSFDFFVEQQNWDEIPAREAHALHQQGHHVHNKSHEEFYRFIAGVHPVEDVSILVDMPYVARTEIEVHEHATLGQSESSEGWGDLKLRGIYRFLKKEQNFLGLLGEAKFPTGSTDEEKSIGELFSFEMQPGSGSWDAAAGAVFQYVSGPVSFYGTVSYTFKTEGDRDYEFGDVFSTYLSLDYLVNQKSDALQVRVGADVHWQSEDRHIDDGVTIADSGGDTLFLGPALTLKAGENVSVTGNFLFPVYQDMGGLHQEMDYVWNAGVRVIF